MHCWVACGLLCAVSAVSLARAQTAVAAPESSDVAGNAFGSVSGHVYCSDTNQPARFATVILEPGPEKETIPAKTGRIVSNSGPPAARTGLDGSFIFSGVKSGTYFLVAEYAGYVSPLANLAPEDIRSDDPADIEKVQKALLKVIVAANKDSAQDIELERGAAISGTVRYDDGSPANGIVVSVLRLESDGKTSDVSLSVNDEIRSAFNARNEGLQTSDLGHYRVSGLPAGKYIVKTTFPTEIRSFGGMFGGPPGGSTRLVVGGDMSVYSGDVFRKKDAETIVATAGSERDDVDITIPLLGLHSLSGSIVALSDGHPINSATVSLLFAADKSELRSSDVSPDGRFTFLLVPEGAYILRIAEAGDVSKQLIQEPETGTTQLVVTTLHSYASVDQPISVDSDLAGININVPDKSASEQAPSTAQKQ
jgi:hypothetical protein